MSEPPDPFVDRTPGAPDVRGVVHRPAEANGDGLVLTHGAGSNAESPLLVSLAEAFAANGVTVLRCDLPFRHTRPTGPPSPRGAATDREGLRRAVLGMRAMAPGRVVVGGHSYGGRQASILVAAEPDLVAALVLLAYPLHPPTRPTELRTPHFGGIRCPALFVHGTTDPFGSIDELTAALALIPAPTRLLTVDGVGHDLGRGRRPTKAGAPFAETVVRELSDLLARKERAVRRA